MKLMTVIVLVVSVASGRTEDAASRKEDAMKLGEDIKMNIDQAVKLLRQARAEFPELGHPVERATASIEILGRAIQNVFLNLENPYFNGTSRTRQKDSRPRVWNRRAAGPRKDGFVSLPKEPSYKF
ncbi:hypothetical protein HIM_02451 [Hirsutella minnesotensis 3608]|nr:hypothetical protein HIM_02451 [Hirsutella minnesotensis 3608]